MQYRFRVSGRDLLQGYAKNLSAHDAAMVRLQL